MAVCACEVSSAVRVDTIPGKGRGYIATRQCRPRETLLLERPYCCEYHDRLQLVLAVATQRRFAQLSFDAGRPLSEPPAMAAKHGINAQAWSDACARVRQNVFMTAASRLCIYSAVSILNHSCDPNAALVTTESADGMPGGPHSLPAAVCAPTGAGGNVEVETARVVTLRNIVAGEEVTIAYRADWMALQVQYRREQLLNTWGFVCQCARCKLEATVCSCVASGSDHSSSKGASVTNERETAKFQWGNMDNEAARSKHKSCMAAVFGPYSYPDRAALLQAELSHMYRTEAISYVPPDWLLPALLEHIYHEQCTLPRLHHFRLRATRALRRVLETRRHRGNERRHSTDWQHDMQVQLSSSLVCGVASALGDMRAPIKSPAWMAARALAAAIDWGAFAEIEDIVADRAGDR